MYIEIRFGTGILSLSSYFQYSRYIDKRELNGTFQDKICRKKVFLWYMLHAEPIDSSHFIM